MTLPSVAIQTYLTLTAKRFGQSPSITFTNGATAGFEVVSVDSSNNITVQIQSGVSTMLQVKTAILAHVATSGFSASDLVTVSITTGHNSDVVKTLVGAVLSGGITSAVKASGTFGGLVFTADSAGTGGNALTVKFTPDATAGAEMVSVSGSDWTIQIADAGASQSYTPFNYPVAGVSYSTIGQVKAAIDAYQMAHSVIFDLSYAFGFSEGDPAFVSSAPLARNLTGGLAASPATVVVQGITITSNTNDATQNGATFSATTGATAGAEVVTVVGNNVSVQIQEGVSTVTQVVTALQAAGSFTALYTATGSSSTAVRTVNGVTMTGAVGTNDQQKLIDQTTITLTTTYQYVPFGFRAKTVFAQNIDLSNTHLLVLSLDGVNDFDSLKGASVAQSGYALDQDSEQTYTDLHVSGIWLKYSGTTPSPFKIVAYASI